MYSLVIFLLPASPRQPGTHSLCLWIGLFWTFPISGLTPCVSFCVCSSHWASVLSGSVHTVASVRVLPLLVAELVGHSVCVICCGWTLGFSALLLLLVVLLCIVYTCLCGHVFSVLSGGCLAVEFLGHMVTLLCLTFWGTVKWFPKWLHHFTFPLAVSKSSNFFVSSPTLVCCLSFLIIVIPACVMTGAWVVQW